jgi:hypothetical protein
MLPPVVHLTREMLQSPTFHYHVNVPTAIERLKQGRPPLPTVEELAEQQRQRDLEQQQTQSRRTRRPDDEYDMEDPFIDDQDAPNRGQYESVLLPLLSHDADGHNDEEEGGGAKANWTGDVNFYVYRGPLEVDVIEKYKSVTHILSLMCTRVVGNSRRSARAKRSASDPKRLERRPPLGPIRRHCSPQSAPPHPSRARRTGQQERKMAMSSQGGRSPGWTRRSSRRASKSGKRPT